MLPGVDPCDAPKTSQTLRLLSTVLAWLPLRKTYTAADAAGLVGPDGALLHSYLSLVRQVPFVRPCNAMPATNSLFDVFSWAGRGSGARGRGAGGERYRGRRRPGPRPGALGGHRGHGGGLGPRAPRQGAEPFFSPHIV